MGIDTFTLVAQVFNFALLVFLLRLVLYRPVLEALRRRREALEGEHSDARTAREAAEREAEEHRRATRRLEEGRAEALSAARQEAEALGERLKDEARREADQARAEWIREVDRESEAFLEDVRSLVAGELFAVAGAVLRDVADADLEARSVDVFTRRIGEMEPPEREAFERAVEGAGGKVRVRAAHDPTDAQRTRIETALRAWLGTDVTISFEVDAALTLGFELMAGDRKIGWSVRSRLEGLEEESRTLFEGAGGGR